MGILFLRSEIRGSLHSTKLCNHAAAYQIDAISTPQCYISDNSCKDSTRSFCGNGWFPLERFIRPFIIRSTTTFDPSKKYPDFPVPKGSFITKAKFVGVSNGGDDDTQGLETENLQNIGTFLLGGDQRFKMASYQDWFSDDRKPMWSMTFTVEERINSSLTSLVILHGLQDIIRNQLGEFQALTYLTGLESMDVIQVHSFDIIPTFISSSSTSSTSSSSTSHSSPSTRSRLLSQQHQNLLPAQAVSPGR
jgi:hypothetical protein